MFNRDLVGVHQKNLVYYFFWLGPYKNYPREVAWSTREVCVKYHV